MWKTVDNPVTQWNTNRYNPQEPCITNVCIYNSGDMHIKWQSTPVSAAHDTGINRRAWGCNPNSRRLWRPRHTCAVAHYSKPVLLTSITPTPTVIHIYQHPMRHNHTSDQLYTQDTPVPVDNPINPVDKVLIKLWISWELSTSWQAQYVECG